MHDLSDLHAVLAGQVIVAAHHICAGLFSLFEKLFIKIRRDPVICINKADPVSLCCRQPQIFCAALLTIFLRCDHYYLLGIFPFITAQDLKGIIC